MDAIPEFTRDLLVSLHPRHASKILCGEKTVELRRRFSAEHGIGLFVDGANYDDVARDKNETRRAVTLSKLAKFQQLRGIPLPDEAGVVARFGAINNDNDRSDIRFLAALDVKAVDFVVSQDISLHRRADRAGLGANIFTVEEALQWVKRLFGVKAVTLPATRGARGGRVNKTRRENGVAFSSSSKRASEVGAAVTAPPAAQHDWTSAFLPCRHV